MRSERSLFYVGFVAAALCAGVLAACGDDEDPPEEQDRGALTVYSSLPLQGDSRPQSLAAPGVSDDAFQFAHLATPFERVA